MRLILANPSLLSNSPYYRWAKDVTNKILSRGDAVEAIYLPVFQMFPNSERLTAERLFDLISTIPDVPVEMYTQPDAMNLVMNAVSRVCTEDPNAQYIRIGVSIVFFNNSVSAPMFAQYNSQLAILVGLLHGTAQIITPHVTTLLGLPEDQPAPDNIGHFAPPQYANKHKGGDCGFGMEFLLFNGGVLATPSAGFENLLLVSLIDATGLASPQNMRHRVLPTGDVEMLIQALDSWATPMEVQAVRPLCFRWPFHCCKSLCPRPFPVNSFNSHANYERLADAEGPIPVIVVHAPPPAVTDATPPLSPREKTDFVAQLEPQLEPPPKYSAQEGGFRATSLRNVRV